MNTLDPTTPDPNQPAPVWRPKPGSKAGRLLAAFEREPGCWLPVTYLSRVVDGSNWNTVILMLRRHGYDIVNKKARQQDGTAHSWFIFNGYQPAPQ